MNAPFKINHGLEFANKLRSLKASVANEASLIKISMQEDILKSRDGREIVIARYAPEFEKLWAWESHLQKMIENEHSCSGFTPSVTVEPDHEPMPRSRRRVAGLMLAELDDGSNDPLFSIMAQFFGASFVLSISKSSSIKDPLLTLRAELQRRLKPSPKASTTTMVTSALALKPKKLTSGKSTTAAA